MLAVGESLPGLAGVEAPDAGAIGKQRTRILPDRLGILGRIGIAAIVVAAAAIERDEQVALAVEGDGMAARPRQAGDDQCPAPRVGTSSSPLKVKRETPVPDDA